METIVEYRYRSPLHPLHAVCLAGAAALYLAAALSDAAYARAYEIQWANFSAWLIAGGLVLGAVALLCCVLGLARAAGRGRRGLSYIVLLIVTWGLGFFNALVHARDAWAMMPLGLVLSVIVTLLAMAACWVGMSAPRTIQTRSTQTRSTRAGGVA